MLLDSLENISAYDSTVDSTLETLLKKANQYNNHRLQMEIWSFDGHVKSMRNDFKGALESLEKATTYFDVVDDTTAMIKVYIRKGTAESRLTNIENALSNYFLGLKYAESVGELIMQKAILHNIGMAYFKLGDYDNSLKYARKSIIAANAAGEDIEVETTYNSMGNAFKRIGQRDSAIYYYNLARQGFEERGSEYATASIESNIGLYLSENEDYIEAEKYFKNALARMRKIGPNPNFQTVLTAYSGLLIMTKRPQQALSLIDEAEEMAINSGNKLGELNVLLKRAEAYKAMNRSALAYDYLDKAYDLNDSIYDEYLATAAIESEAKFEANKKEQAIALNEMKMNQQRRFIWISVISLLFMLLIALLLVIFIYRLRKLNYTVSAQRGELEKKAFKLEQKNEELNNLNTMKNKLFSIISHDIRTPIHSIRSIIELLKIQEENESLEPELLEELDHSVAASTDMIQKLLQWSKVQLKGFSAKPQLIKLRSAADEALEPLEDHADRKNIILNNWVDEDLYCYTDLDVIRVVIYNLTQNAIKFSNEGDTIEISAQVNGGRVVISVEDNGIGMEESTYKKLKSKNEFVTNYGTKNEKGAGLGLMLCREFIAMVDGHIDFESELGKGTTFFIDIPATDDETIAQHQFKHLTDTN